MPQFSWIAPPASSSSRTTAAASAPLAPARNWASARCRSPGPASDRGNAVAAIDRDDRAGYVGALRRGKEQQRAAQILDLPDPLHRDARRELLSGLAHQEFAV